MQSSANPCGHGQIEGTVHVSVMPDPKRINGRIYRDKLMEHDPVGCYLCGQFYPDTLPEEMRAVIKGVILP